MKRTLVVSGFDLHYPKVDWPTFKAMLSFIEANKPQCFIFGGDQFDNECISHHTKSKPYYRPRAAYMRDQQGFEKGILGPLEALLPKDCEREWLVGNHDDWEFQLVEANPELEGLIDRVAALGLKDRGWGITPIGGTLRYGKLNFCHGEWLTGIGNQAGVYPAKKLVENSGSNAVAGHTHAPQSYTRVSLYNQTQKHMGWISPILGRVNPSYMKRRPSSWVNGFNVTEFQPSGAFNHYPVVVTNGVCIYGGREYRG